MSLQSVVLSQLLIFKSILVRITVKGDCLGREGFLSLEKMDEEGNLCYSVYDVEEDGYLGTFYPAEFEVLKILELRRFNMKYMELMTSFKTAHEKVFVSALQRKQNWGRREIVDLYNNASLAVLESILRKIYVEKEQNENE